MSGEERRMAAKVSASGGSSGFTKEERDAINSRAAELRKESKQGRGNKKATQEAEVFDKIASMEPADRAIAERIHALVAEHAPDLVPRLWYSQPAYARDGKVVCFFRSGHDDKERYSSFGFSEAAELDVESGVWPTAFAVSEMLDDAAATIAVLIKRTA